MKKCKHCSETITGKSHYCSVRDETICAVTDQSLFYPDINDTFHNNSDTDNSGGSIDFGGGDFGSGGGGDCY